jgi:hypothetical protein
MNAGDYYPDSSRIRLHSSVVEQRFCKPQVVGSTPTAGSIRHPPKALNLNGLAGRMEAKEGFLNFAPKRTKLHRNEGKTITKPLRFQGVWLRLPSAIVQGERAMQP